MSTHLSGRRAAVLTVLVPLASAGMLLTAAPAGAIPFEGEPDPTQCVRILSLPDSSTAGSTLFVSHGHAAVLVPRAGC
jgi:hypothetical protein